MAYEIQQRDVPEQLVLTEQRTLFAREIPEWMGATIGRLIGSAEEHGGLRGAPFAVFHGPVTDEAADTIEVCVPIGTDREGSSAAPMRSEPAHREAYTRLAKAQVAFPQILAAYEAVEARIHEEGLTHAGPPREVYFTDFAAAAPDDEVCDVAFPIR